MKNELSPIENGKNVVFTSGIKWKISDSSESKHSETKLYFVTFVNK